jgi:L-ornithine N5-monooxygenase
VSSCVHNIAYKLKALTLENSVNEVFNPDRVSTIYNLPSKARAAAIASDRNTNYGVVRIELLEHIYETLYTQRITHASEADWPHRILSHHTVTDVSGSRDSISLSLDDASDPRNLRSGAQSFDLVVVATGYTRNAHENLLGQARHLMPGGGESGEKWEVTRDYRVKFAKGLVSRDAGVWLQGCNQETHGLADTLLSILAVRGGEIVSSVFGRDEEGHEGGQGHEPIAV